MAKAEVVDPFKTPGKSRRNSIPLEGNLWSPTPVKPEFGGFSPIMPQISVQANKPLPIQAKLVPAAGRSDEVRTETGLVPHFNSWALPEGAPQKIEATEVPRSQSNISIFDPREQGGQKKPVEFVAGTPQKGGSRKNKRSRKQKHSRKRKQSKSRRSRKQKTNRK
jgi:hypothetical protein